MLMSGLSNILRNDIEGCRRSLNSVNIVPDGHVLNVVEMLWPRWTAEVQHMTFTLLSQESNPSQPTLPKSITRARHLQLLTQQLSGGLGHRQTNTSPSGSVRAFCLGPRQHLRDASPTSPQSPRKQRLDHKCGMAHRCAARSVILNGRMPARGFSRAQAASRQHVTARGGCSDRHGFSGTAREVLNGDIFPPH